MEPDILFVNVRIFDGDGAPPFLGEARVHGERIAAVARDGARLPRDGARMIEGRGRTLMPGLTEAHAHLTWPTSVEKQVPGMWLPPEELALTAARNARILLDHGFTSAYSGGALSKSLEVVLSGLIDAGGLPGPRLIPASIERAPASEGHGLELTGGEGHGSEGHGGGPEALRAFVADAAQSGARIVKFLLSGESALSPGASHQVLYSDEEIRAASQQARQSGVWLTGHAHAAEAVKLGLRHGFRVLYHCTYADEEALDLFEQHAGEVFVAPSIGILQATLDARPPPHIDMSHMKRDAELVLDRQRRLVPELRRRGVRLLPGGDYGFPFNPNGRNARDLELWVTHLGYRPLEVLHAATALGGELMGRPRELGRVAEGYLADLLLVDGDPTRDIAILQDRTRLSIIMKGGQLYKAEPPSA